MDPESLDVGTDPQLRAELETARTWGVSWRRFCGWEPIRTTRYVYDDAGRLVRAVTTTEPEWDDQQRSAAYALTEFEAGLCPGCRQQLSETTDPATEYRYVHVGPPLRCNRCTMAQMYAEANKDEPQAEALLFNLQLKPEVPDDSGDG